MSLQLQTQQRLNQKEKAVTTHGDNHPPLPKTEGGAHPWKVQADWDKLATQGPLLLGEAMSPRRCSTFSCVFWTELRHTLSSGP